MIIEKGREKRNQKWGCEGGGLADGKSIPFVTFFFGI